jgi:two-component system NarL family response regulator
MELNPMKTTIRVLIADDHAFFRKTVCDAIGNQPGFTVVDQAENGQSAVHKVQEHKPNVVLMDVSMPVMDGAAATRHITSTFPKVKVVALSAHEDDHHLEKMFQAGVAAYLPKSCRREDMLRVIRQVSLE